MALFLEEYDKKVAKKGLYVPLKLQQAASAELTVLDNAGIPKQQLKGLKTIAATNTSYNKNENNPDTKGEEKETTNYISADVADKALDRWGKTNSITPKTPIGNDIKAFYDKVKAKASRQDKVSPVEPPKPTANPTPKPEIEKAKTISMPNGQIRLAASREINPENKKIYITEEQITMLYGKYNPKHTQ